MLIPLFHWCCPTLFHSVSLLFHRDARERIFTQYKIHKHTMYKQKFKYKYKYAMLFTEILRKHELIFGRCICEMYLCRCAVVDGLGGYKLAMTVARFTSELSTNSKSAIQPSCNNTGTTNTGTTNSKSSIQPSCDNTGTTIIACTGKGKYRCAINDT